MKSGDYSETEIKELVEYMKAEGVQYLYTGHCTGEEAFHILKKYGGELVQDLSTGKVVEIFS